MDAAAWDERYAATELVWGAPPNRFLPAEVAELVPGRALDLACGEGRNAVWLATAGWRVTAVDFSRVAIDKGRRLAAEAEVEVGFVVADVTSHVPQAGAYDLVIIFYLQLVRSARLAVLERALEALAPGGTLLVVAHDLANLERGHGGPQDPAVLPTAPGLVSEMRGLAVGAGLEVVDAGERERVMETGDGPATAIDCLVRVRRPGGLGDATNTTAPRLEPL